MSRSRDLAAVATGYLLGSLPIGIWLGRAARHIDVREHGSGGTGTTNGLRTGGPGAADRGRHGGARSGGGWVRPRRREGVGGGRRRAPARVRSGRAGRRGVG